MLVQLSHWKGACNTLQPSSPMKLPSRSGKIVITAQASQHPETIISSTQLGSIRPLRLNPPEPSWPESSELSSSETASLAAAASSICTSGSSATSSSLLLLLLCSGEVSSSGTSLGVGLRLLVVRRLLARLPADTGAVLRLSTLVIHSQTLRDQTCLQAWRLEIQDAVLLATYALICRRLAPVNCLAGRHDLLLRLQLAVGGRRAAWLRAGRLEMPGPGGPPQLKIHCCSLTALAAGPEPSAAAVNAYLFPWHQITADP